MISSPRERKPRPSIAGDGEEEADGKKECVVC